MSNGELTVHDRRDAKARERRGHRLVSRFWSDASGSTAIEYALVGGLVFLGIVAALRAYADRVSVMYNYIATSFLR